MVPIPENSYFPALDNCLNGEQLLLSWKSAFAAISTSADSSQEEDSSAIRHFFFDPQTIKLLSRPFDRFPKPSPQTKSAFDTKTSAINVPPSSNARYDIKEIKDDAIWLSQEAEIDEISALRVVVLEYQSRSASQLLGSFSEEEILSLRDFAGNTKSWGALPISFLSEGIDADTIQTNFATQEARRIRILYAYFSDRRYFLKCVETFFSKIAYEVPFQPADREPNVSEDAWLVAVAEKVAKDIENSEDDWPTQCFNAVKSQFELIDNSGGWYKNEIQSEGIELEWENTQITEAIHLMEILFQTLDCMEDIPSAELVLQWFQIVYRYNFFNVFNTPLVFPMQTIATIISLSILTLGSCLNFLSTPAGNGERALPDAPKSPYILNRKVLNEIHSVLMDIAERAYQTAGPAVFAWSVILKTIKLRVIDYKASQDLNEHEKRNSLQPKESERIDTPRIPDMYEQVMHDLIGGVDEDPIDYLALNAVNGSHVFETLSALSLRLGNTLGSCFSPLLGARMRIVILDLIHSSNDIGYIPEIVDCAISALTGGQEYWDLKDSYPLPKKDDPIAIFLGNEDLVESILKNAISRYPYESLPFLKLIRALAACTIYEEEGLRSVIEILDGIPTFTFLLPDSFWGYETAHEEDNNNTIRLTQSIRLFEPRSKFKMLISRGQSSALVQVNEDFCLPAGTGGRKLLETFLTASDQLDATTGEIVPRESVAEIIGIFSTLLLGISKSKHVNYEDNAQHVLEHASSGLTRNRDITTVIFDIFEEELQKHSNNPGLDIPLDVLISCLQFIHTLVPISPGRVWPLIARSGLLGIDRGRLSSIVGNIEAKTGRYDFLSSCEHLFESLTQNFVDNAVERKFGNKALARFSPEQQTTTIIPDQVYSKVLLSITGYSIYVLENSCTWKFEREDDRRRLSLLILWNFNDILGCVYGIGGSPKASSQIMEPLAPAAKEIIDSFLSTATGTLTFQPILRAFYDGFSIPETTIFLDEMHLRINQAGATLKFSTSLLRIATMLNTPSPHFEAHLFTASPLIARLYAAANIYRRPVLSLFKALIASTSNNEAEPPSLLGYLGRQTSRNFIHLLSDFDKPLCNTQNVNTIWHFFSMVVSSRQQWFANYLLTGKTPKGTGRSKTSASPLDKTVLDIALSRLSKPDDGPQSTALAMLEFVSLAQNFWPWTMYELQKHSIFIQSISSTINNLTPYLPSTKREGSVAASYSIRMAAYMAEILAMHIFHSRQTGTRLSIKDVFPRLPILPRFPIGVPSYNSSLHANLTRNFEKRYAGCSLQNLQRTDLEDRQLGQNYFYDITLADKMLSFDKAWTGRKDDGYHAELLKANVNLSLVTSQIALLQSWKFLAIELSSDFSEEEIFMNLNHTRAELALVLLQRLIGANVSSEGTKEVLARIWETIRLSGSNFGGSGDATYYRILLKMLYLGLRVHARSSPDTNNALSASKRMAESSSITQTVLDILDRVVAQGFRDLAAAAHDNLTDSSPEDIDLITGILQACLRIPSIEFCHPQVVALMVNCGVARDATSLFSWSDDRLAINGDPIYGQLSILFLVELSTIPTMAEQLAVDGVLGHIASANITTYLRRGNISPFADSVGLQRCYNIWVRGILPLLLNLLDSVGISIAAEVAIFLNQFPSLLQQSSEAFDAPEASRTVSRAQTKYISLSVCSEVHSLSLLLFILNGYRETTIGTVEIPEVRWDAASIVENVEFWLGSRALLREKILPMGSRDVELANRKLQSGHESGAITVLEEKAVMEMTGIRDILSGGDA
ncbi:hypothetical protein B7494_g7043 [Chlorociboria aeruginascens]|nr:hypothetical protein B7494_g7043 [Chlorociboria aeruginascens]